MIEMSSKYLDGVDERCHPWFSSMLSAPEPGRPFRHPFRLPAATRSLCTQCSRGFILIILLGKQRPLGPVVSLAFFAVLVFEWQSKCPPGPILINLAGGENVTV